MIDSRYLDVLRKLHARLASSPIDWSITGSCGFALHGLEVTVHDIDIQTGADGAYAIERLFAEHSVRSVRYAASERICSHFGALEIDGVQVEIMGALQKRLEDGSWEAPVDITLHREWIAVAGMSVPVLSLEYEYHAYRTLGRLEKAEMLRKRLRN